MPRRRDLSIVFSQSFLEIPMLRSFRTAPAILSVLCVFLPLVAGAFLLPSAAPAVATGDSRTVTEPAFPAVCTTLNAALTSVSDDLPTSVDATISNSDGARIQAALNSCANTGQAVELSMDGAGHNAFLTGPLSMP